MPRLYYSGVNEILLGLLAAMLSTNPVVTVSNLVAQTTGVRLQIVDPADPVEQELDKIMEADDKAQAEIDQWIRDNTAFAAEGADYSQITLNARIQERFEKIKKAYEDFIQRHPNHARARLAYGSFLNDFKLEEEAKNQWEKARELDPKNPTPWNNLADYYSHRGPVRKAFEYLETAIKLNPFEPVYFRNLATLVFLFRKDAKEIYNLKDDEAVFRRAIDLYMRARRLDPDDFTLATDVAQVYYFLKPEVTDDPEESADAAAELAEETLAAWDEALKLARTELDRQGVLIHQARVCIQYDRLTEAREHLKRVTNSALATLKNRLERNLEEKEKQKAASPPAIEPAKAPPKSES